jgi:hypothetical protein
MWLLRFRWPITIGQCLGEGTRSRLRLTGVPREWYARILENEPLIWPKGGNSGRRTIFGTSSVPIRESEFIGQRVLGPKGPLSGRSRNNSR